MAWHPFRNLGLKVLALGLGGLLWFTLSGQQVERTIRAPIEYVNKPPALEIEGDLTDTVFVHVRGTDSQIGRITPGDIHALIDLAGFNAVTRGTFALPKEQIVVPFGVEVLRVDPPEVTLTLERSGSWVVPVVPDIVGTPAAGFVRGAVKVDPATVEVIGPESQGKLLDHATTARIAIEGATAAVTQTVNITVPGSSLRLRGSFAAHVTIAIVRAKDRQ